VYQHWLVQLALLSKLCNSIRQATTIGDAFLAEQHDHCNYILNCIRITTTLSFYTTGLLFWELSGPQKEELKITGAGFDARSFAEPTVQSTEKNPKH